VFLVPVMPVQSGLLSLQFHIPPPLVLSDIHASKDDDAANRTSFIFVLVKASYFVLSFVFLLSLMYQISFKRFNQIEVLYFVSSEWS